MLSPVKPGVMSLQTFCEWAAIGKTTAYQEINEHRLETIIVGNRRLVPMDAAERWLSFYRNRYGG